MIIELGDVKMLDELVVEYNKLQKKYVDPSLDSITFGGCKKK